MISSKMDLMINKNNIYAQEFAEWMQKWARVKEMSQADIARSTKLSRQTINTIWNGRSRPLPENCRLIANALTRPEQDALEAAGRGSIKL